MPRTCTVCSHDLSHVINTELVRGGGNRRIAAQYGLSETSVRRHRADHIPELLVKAAEALEAAHADDLLSEVRDLQRRTYAVLEATEQTREHRTALAAIKEARSNLELLARLLGELDSRLVVNLSVHPEWIELRALIVGALAPHPDARDAVVEAIRSQGQELTNNGHG